MCSRGTREVDCIMEDINYLSDWFGADRLDAYLLLQKPHNIDRMSLKSRYVGMV